MVGAGHCAYHGAFGHSTVTASVWSERGIWSASTSTRLELSNNEALFVGAVMSADYNSFGVQLGLGQALNLLNAGNAAFNSFLNNGGEYVDRFTADFIKDDALRKIAAPGSLGLSDVKEHRTSIFSSDWFSNYDMYASYLEQEYYSCMLDGKTYYGFQVDLRNQLIGQDLMLFAAGMTMISLYNAPTGVTYSFSPNSRLDMIEYNLMKNGYVPYESTIAYSAFTKSASSGGGSTTKLYRAMSQSEYDAMINNGNKFTQPPAGPIMEEKWFATTQQDASQWGSIFYPSGNYRIIEVELPTNSLNQMYYMSRLDGIGPAFSGSIDFLNSTMKGIILIK